MNENFQIECFLVPSDSKILNSSDLMLRFNVNFESFILTCRACLSVVKDLYILAN